MAGFPSHLHKIKFIESDLCECGDIGDINHLLFNCRLKQKESDRLTQRLQDVGFARPLSVNYILASQNFTALQILVEKKMRYIIDISKSPSLCIFLCLSSSLQTVAYLFLILLLKSS